MLQEQSTVRAALEACLNAWEASDGELPLSDTSGETPFTDFAHALQDSLSVAAATPVGRVPEQWLEAYLVDAPDGSESQEEGADSGFMGWLAMRTGCGIENLTEALSERFLRLRRPLAAFTTQEVDETILPETPISGDKSVFASIFKRGGRLLLRLQSQNAALQNEIVAILLPRRAESSDESGLFFVAMAATGVGDWSVGWAHLSEAERDAILPDAQMELRQVRLSDKQVRLLPLLSLAAAEDARAGTDPLSRAVWMEWMDRWRRETQDASAA